MAELLLVDNDARITELVAWFLAQRGHRVRRATSFAAARVLIDELRPDLMLSDVELGRESARVELPALARERRLPPTLVVSGYLDSDLLAVLSTLPEVVGTLAKPFDLAALEERVESLLAPAGGARAGAPLADGWIEVEPGRAPFPVRGRDGGTLR